MRCVLECAEKFDAMAVYIFSVGTGDCCAILRALCTQFDQPSVSVQCSILFCCFVSRSHEASHAAVGFGFHFHACVLDGKEYCEMQFDHADDEKKSPERANGKLTAGVEDGKETIATLKA